MCGAVSYKAQNLRDVIGCHCKQCRKQTGNFMTATAAKNIDFELIRSDGLKWYRSSPTAERGFCKECGSVLFWSGEGKDYIAITAGSLDNKTELKLEGHIFCDDAGDYYEIVGGAYQKPQW